MNLDFLTKELVRSFFYTNVRLDRDFTKEVELNGRLYTKYCQDTSTFLTGHLYKLNNGNDGSYLLLVGRQRQLPNDLNQDTSKLEELSSTNSFSHPSIMVELDHEISYDEFCALAEWYIGNQKRSELYTQQEIDKLAAINNGSIHQSTCC